jgi:hypothetical protein
MNIAEEYVDIGQVNLTNLCLNNHPDISKYIKMYVEQIKKKYDIDEKNIFSKDAVFNLCLNPQAKEYAKYILTKVRIIERFNFSYTKLLSDGQAIELLEMNLDKLKLDRENIYDLCGNPRAKTIIETVIYLQRKHLEHSHIGSMINNSKNYEILSYKNSYDYLEKQVLMANNLLIDWNDIFAKALGKNSKCMMDIIENNIDNILLLNVLPQKFYANPNLLHLIEKKLEETISDKMQYYHVYAGLCMNPKAIHIIDKLDLSILLHYNSGYRLEYLCSNSNPEVLRIVKKYVHLLNKYRDYTAINEINKSPFLWIILYEYDILIEEQYLFRNEYAISLINKLLSDDNSYFHNQNVYKSICFNANLQYININNLIEKFDSNCWYILCKRKDAMHLVEKHICKLDMHCWFGLCSNPSAIEIINNNIHKLDEYCWETLCANEKAAGILERNLDKLNKTCWSILSRMPNAIQILINNKDKICYDNLCMNSNGFQILVCYNVRSVIKYKYNLNKELTQFVLNPDWIGLISKRYNTPFYEYVTKYYY